MAEISRLIKLANYLSAWQMPPKPPVVKTQPVAFGEDTVPMSRDEWDRQREEYTQRTYGEVYQAISEFLPLFISASQDERLEAAKLIRRPESKTIWTVFWHWNPPHVRDNEWLNIDYARQALISGKLPPDDPRDSAQLQWPPAFTLTRSDPDWLRWAKDIDKVINAAG